MHKDLENQKKVCILVDMKVCTKCNVKKPLTEFYKDSTKVDKLQFWCKVCKSNYSKVLHIKNKGKHIKTSIMKDGYGVYKITHIPTQMFYIGSGKISSRRWRHFSYLKNNMHHNKHMQTLYNKSYDKSDWLFEIIVSFDYENVDECAVIEVNMIKEATTHNSNKLLNMTLYNK